MMDMEDTTYRDDEPKPGPGGWHRCADCGDEHPSVKPERHFGLCTTCYRDAVEDL